MRGPALDTSSRLPSVSEEEAGPPLFTLSPPAYVSGALTFTLFHCPFSAKSREHMLNAGTTGRQTIQTIANF